MIFALALLNAPQIAKMVSPIINVNSACNYPEINKLIDKRIGA
jgi:hypothetical protein